ncbi:MAG: hypothetical protein R2856_39955 [Caldilineaceae bacterium]
MSKSIIAGPTYAEMRDPMLLPSSVREAAQQALHEDELSRSISSTSTGKTPATPWNALCCPRN